MDDAIHIEPAATADRDLVDALARLVPQLSSSAAVPTLEQVQEIVASPCTTLLVARDRRDAGKIVGSLTLAVFRIPTGVRAWIDVRAWIEDVVVDPGTRGRGIGAALTHAALRIAASRGARTVELTSRPSRVDANRLYQRLGFQPRETNVYRYSYGADEATAV
jgi:ribosomal protein S18 acetylase RimI-like enzyme